MSGQGWPVEGFEDCSTIEEVMIEQRRRQKEFSDSLQGRRRAASLEVLKVLNEKQDFHSHIFDMDELGLLFVHRPRGRWKRDWITLEPDPRKEAKCG